VAHRLDVLLLFNIQRSPDHATRAFAGLVIQRLHDSRSGCLSVICGTLDRGLSSPRRFQPLLGLCSPQRYADVFA
jgi:hypothetical protein